MAKLAMAFGEKEQRFAPVCYKVIYSLTDGLLQTGWRLLLCQFLCDILSQSRLVRLGCLG
jgi:hypothetical protein